MPLRLGGDLLSGAIEIVLKELLEQVARRMFKGKTVVGAVIAVKAVTGEEKYSRIGDRTLALGLTKMLEGALMDPVRFDYEGKKWREGERGEDER